jgi:hypothetical protein
MAGLFIRVRGSMSGFVTFYGQVVEFEGIVLDFMSGLLYNDYRTSHSNPNLK